MEGNIKQTSRFSRRTLLKSVAGTSALAFTGTPGRAASNRHAMRQDVSQPPPKGDLLSSEEIRLLALMFNDTPYTGGQDTPNHVWKWVTDDSFIFFHFDQADVTEATALDYFGLGVKGTFCEEQQPHPDFTHFHKWTSPQWELAHGGEAGDYGYWLLHVAVREFEAPWGQVVPGVDRNFHPTPPPTCNSNQ